MAATSQPLFFFPVAFLFKSRLCLPSALEPLLAGRLCLRFGSGACRVWRAMEYVVARVEDHPFEFEEVMQTRWIAHSMCTSRAVAWVSPAGPTGGCCVDCAVRALCGR